MFPFRQFPQSLTFRDTNRMYGTNYQIIFIQFRINLLNFGSATTACDGKVISLYILRNSFLKVGSHTTTNGKNSNLLLVEFLQRNEIFFVLQQSNGFCIQLSGQPSCVCRIQPIRKSFQRNRLIPVQSGYIFILQNLLTFVLHQFHRDDTTFDSFLDSFIIRNGSIRSQQNIISRQQCFHTRIICLIVSSSFHRQGIRKTETLKTQFILQ